MYFFLLVQRIIREKNVRAEKYNDSLDRSTLQWGVTFEEFLTKIKGLKTLVCKNRMHYYNFIMRFGLHLF